MMALLAPGLYQVLQRRRLLSTADLYGVAVSECQKFEQGQLVTLA